MPVLRAKQPNAGKTATCAQGVLKRPLGKLPNSTGELLQHTTQSSLRHRHTCADGVTPRPLARTWRHRLVVSGVVLQTPWAKINPTPYHLKWRRKCPEDKKQPQSMTAWSDPAHPMSTGARTGCGTYIHSINGVTKTHGNKRR